MHNLMRLQALRTSGARTSSRVGLVTSYDPSNYAVVATLQPDNVQTGWLAYAACWVGNGFGMYAPPSIGQRISVELIDGDLDAGFAELSFFDNDNRPLEVQSGEFWLVHQKGQSFKLTNDGKLTISDGQGASVVLDGSGNIESAATTWTHTGNLVVTENITSDNGNITASAGNVSDQKGSMQDMRNTYNEHTQPVVSGTADAPNQQM
jgi:uncharacterized protein involved in type VI secretion and phage assembly